MFVETIYVNEQNRQEYPMFVMNRDGFTLLAMGFTGKKALKFKLDYIAAYQHLNQRIHRQVVLSCHITYPIQYGMLQAVL